MKSQLERERLFWESFGCFLRSLGISELSITSQIGFAKSFIVGLDCRLVDCDESKVVAFFVELGRDPF